MAGYFDYVALVQHSVLAVFLLRLLFGLDHLLRGAGTRRDPRPNVVSQLMPQALPPQ